MQAKMLWWDDDEIKHVELVDVKSVNQYGELDEESNYLEYNGSIFYKEESNGIISFRRDDGFKAKRHRKSLAPKAYYRLTESIVGETEKAIAVVTESNGCISRNNLKLFYTWIPKSQIKIVNQKLYIASWLIKNLPFDFIDRNDSIAE